MNEKIRLLIEIDNLHKRGFIPTRYLTLHSELSDLEFEYESLKYKCEMIKNKNTNTDGNLQTPVTGE